MEEEQGLPPTAHFKDLDQEKRFVESEMNFLKFIVMPLFELSNSFMEEKMQEEKDCISRNFTAYEKMFLDSSLLD